MESLNKFYVLRKQTRFVILYWLRIRLINDWLLRVFVYCLVLSSPAALADYYLKFEASGAALPIGTPLSTSNDAWLRLSIVDSYPQDGPIHYAGDNAIAEVSFRDYHGYFEKNTDVDYTTFYVADVPRSIQLVNRSTSTPTILSFGDTPITLSNAPAVVLGDGTMIAPGVAFVVPVSQSGYSQSIYIAASPPRSLGGEPLDANYTRSNFPPTFSNISLESALRDTQEHCTSGWHHGGVEGQAVMMWQATYAPVNKGCQSYLIYVGKVSHVVRYQ